VKVTAPQDVLAAVTGWIAATTATGVSGPLSPVLGGMLLTAAADGTLTAARFGYDASATASIAAETGEPGRALIGARLLAQATASLPAGQEVTITTDGTRAVITAGQVTYTLLLLPHDEYPAMPEPGAPAAEFGADHLAAAVAQAVTAASHDDTLPALACVHLALDGEGTATLAATDRYRLAVVTCPYTPHGDGPPVPVLIPARELAAVAKRPGAATVTLGLGSPKPPGYGYTSDPGTATFTTADRQVTARLVAAEFPRYTTLIPGEASAFPVTATVTADLAPLAEALKRAIVVAPSKEHPARLPIGPGEIRIEPGTGDEAGYAETVGAQLDGDPHNVAFNPRYLLDALGAVAATGAAAARIALTGPAKPALITPASAPDGAVNCRHVLMPIRGTG
jgi:DNA polymerase III subunit beta